MNNLMKGFLLSSLVVLSACVGTVQETNTAITDISSNYTPTLNFSGLQGAAGISDKRIEVFFYPAAGGSGKYIYDIYVGNRPQPISLPSDVLTPDYRGLLRYTITDLEPMTSYPITIQVRDQKSVAKSTSDVVKVATTFTNIVAEFDGIGSAANMPGQDGKDSVLIRYTPARFSVGTGTIPHNPNRYELVMVDADRLTPGDMDLDLTTSQGKWIFSWAFDKTKPQNEYVARGLLPNRKYFARMRVLHIGSKEDPYNPQLRGEMNTKYIEISTLSDSLSDINFRADSFELSIPSDTSGLTTFNASWDQVEGVFDHLRIYYSKKGALSLEELPDLCLSEAQNPTGSIFCKQLGYTETSTLITGLIPYTHYEAVLVVCQTSMCVEGERKPSLFDDAITDPATFFSGITQIEASSSLSSAETIKIHYQDPSSLGGHFDGLILKMRRSEDESTPDVEIIDIPTSDSNVFFYPFDPTNSTQITVGGVDYLSDEPYCFLLYPFKFDADGKKREILNDRWTCIKLTVQAPDGLAFVGLDSGTINQEYVTVKWNAPLYGFFSDYVLFWKKGTGAFEWPKAIAAFNGEDNEYSWRLVPGALVQYTVPDPFEDGIHMFGILTYHVFVSDEGPVQKWSDWNSAYLRCNVNSSSSMTINCE